jgi:hypothetical protein
LVSRSRPINPLGGNEQFPVTTPYTQIATPTAPTLANQNAAGARSITYAVVVCENGSSCSQHTPPSSTTTIANANASPQVKLSAYGDTLYGPRCFDVYVTADSGARTGVPGRIANCAGKSFIDTGANASGSVPSGNTTLLQPTSDPGGGGCNHPEGAPRGVDALPCTPNATDDEGTQTLGGPGDANNSLWTQVNLNGCTFSYTGGMISMSCPTRAGTDQGNCIFQTAPATPYTYTAVVYSNTNAGTMITGLAWRESATNKMTSIGQFYTTSTQAGAVIRAKYTTATTGITFTNQGSEWSITNPVYLQIQNDGTNTNYLWSPDGVTYTTLLSEAKNTFFTTAPDQVGFCLDTRTGAGWMDIDYFRRTQ